MKQFAMTAAAAAAVMMMNPAFAADAAYEADLCVIGAGASGTAAAWAAAEKGMKVITLEKSGLPGGTGKYSEGIFAVESAMQRNWNYGLTKDEAFMKIMNYGHWRGNARMVRAFVDRSADTIDWMIKNGVKFEKLFSNYPNGLYTWHIYEGRGAGWINLFIDKYKKAGQTLLTNTWGQKLITENGRVVGVEATNKAGDKITIRSKATIIATGGFFDNKPCVRNISALPMRTASRRRARPATASRWPGPLAAGRKARRCRPLIVRGPRRFHDQSGQRYRQAAASVAVA